MSSDATTVPRPRVRALAFVALARPRQWPKNALVVAAPGAAGALGHDHVLLRVVLACVAFCALSSGVYAVNDVRDAEEDRRHPTKFRRPVASGALSARAALGFAALALLAGLFLCAAVRPALALVGAGYVALTLSYTLVWRRVPLLDIGVIALGFVLRASAGGVAAPVDLSEWFLLVVSFGALLVAAGKRFAELHRTSASGTSRRRVLDHYTERRLRVLLVLCAAGALVAYCAWAFVMPTERGVPWRPLTIVPFALAMLRYGALVNGGRSEAPEALLARDRPLLMAALVWLVLFIPSVDALR